MNRLLIMSGILSNLKCNGQIRSKLRPCGLPHTRSVSYVLICLVLHSYCVEWFLFFTDNHFAVFILLVFFYFHYYYFVTNKCHVWNVPPLSPRFLDSVICPLWDYPVQLLMCCTLSNVKDFRKVESGTWGIFCSDVLKDCYCTFCEQGNKLFSSSGHFQHW